MLAQARYRAKKLGVPFNLTADDIVVPKLCPALGIPLRRNIGTSGYHPNSPSVDRTVPELGYTKGNIVVISNRANTLKRDATAHELGLIAEWLKDIIKPRH